MEKAGAPVTPGYRGEDRSLKTFKKHAKRIGYPVLLKATAGGGGKGMRMVANEGDLEEALKSARREARSAFGDDRFLLEKFITRARHVEVQIFGDGKGDVVHMFERDCSVQRRHQKIMEEAPAPNLPRSVREKLLQAGVGAAKAVNYRGAGTVEFLYDPSSEAFYFMEMNTRLQVEHPVSEIITGLDLVEWQLRIAAGEGLPLRQEDIRENGHAFQARLYAENPAQNFAPSAGTLTTLRLPHDCARIDSGVEEGQAVTPYYDPMIAKIITHGATRDAALGAMRAALEETRIAGVETNAAFLHALGAAPDFIAGDVSTGFIDDHEALLIGRLSPGPSVFASAVLWKRAQRAKMNADPWIALSGFRLNRPAHEVFWIEYDGAPALLRTKKIGDAYCATLEPNAAAAARRKGLERGESIPFGFSGAAESDGTVSLTIDGKALAAFAAPHKEALRIWIGADCCDIFFVDPLAGIAAHHSSEGSLTAPMPGIITLLSAQPGDAVTAGGVLLVMEAMKMEHVIKAPYDGVVKSYRFSPGDQVKDGDLLVEFEESL
jgi:3-methylcrotonyl-CoA carboxylase alpha subunit